MATEYTYDEEGDTWPFFVIAVLTFILIPATLKWLTTAFKGNDPISYNANIKGAIVEDAETLELENKKKIKALEKRQNSARIFNKTLVFLILGWALVVFLALNYTKEADLQGTFDPYAILDISPSATEKEIKSKYRKLSLKIHPDKAPASAKEEMEVAFVKLQLAYKALTDEPTRENYLKYGHPDGPQNVSHGIAIPKFLVEGKYSPLMVIFYFLLIGVILPLVVGSWWNNVKTHTRKGLHVDTSALFAKKLVDRNPTKVITPEVILDWICQSNEIKTIFPKLSVEQLRLMVHSYLSRDPSPLEGSSEADVLKLISKIPKLIDGFIDLAAVFRAPEILISALDLKKSVVLAVKYHGRHQELLQLPYVNAEVVEKQPVRKLGKLFSVDKQEAGKILGITDAQKLDKALEIGAHIPNIRVIEASFKVPGEEVVTPMSSAHLVLKFLVKSPKHKSAPEVTEEKFKEPETIEYFKNPFLTNEEQPDLPYLYAPYFPGYVKNSWSGLLIAQKDNKMIEGGEVASLTHLDLSNLELSQEEWLDGGKVAVSVFKMPLPIPTAPMPSKTHFRLILKHNAYFGSDIDIPVELVVKPAPAPENKPASQNEEDDDSDDESDISDPEEDTIAGAMAALRGGNVKKSSAAQSESDDDEDEDDNQSVFTDIDTDTEDEKEK